MLNIKDLHTSIAGQDILQGLTLHINPGEVHAIMGPNGSGKSTLARVLAGDPNHEVSAGEVLYQGENLLEKSAEERARSGVFFSYQYPVSIPVVSNIQFLRASVNAMRDARAEPPLDASPLIQSARAAITKVALH